MIGSWLDPALVSVNKRCNSSIATGGGGLAGGLLGLGAGVGGKSWVA